MPLNISEKVLCSIAEAKIQKLDEFFDAKTNNNLDEKFIKPFMKNAFKKLGKVKAVKVVNTLKSMKDEDLKKDYDRCVKKLVAAMSSNTNEETQTVNISLSSAFKLATAVLIIKFAIIVGIKIAVGTLIGIIGTAFIATI